MRREEYSTTLRRRFFVGFPKIKMGGLSRLLRKLAHTLPMLAKPLRQMANYDVH